MIIPPQIGTIRVGLIRYRRSTSWAADRIGGWPGAEVASRRASWTMLA
jgi:hypothetical protein